MKQKLAILFIAIAALSSCKKDTTTNTYIGDKVKSIKITDNKYKSVTTENFEYDAYGNFTKLVLLGKDDSTSTLPYDTGRIITIQYQNNLPSAYTIVQRSSTSGLFDKYIRTFKFDAQNRIILDSLISAVSAMGSFSNTDSVDYLSNYRYSYTSNAQIRVHYTYRSATSFNLWQIDTNFIDASSNFVKESLNFYNTYSTPPTFNSNNTKITTFTQYSNPLYDVFSLIFATNKNLPLETKQYTDNSPSPSVIYNYQYFLNSNNKLLKYIETIVYDPSSLPSIDTYQFEYY